MDFDLEDYEPFYHNRVQLFADILDSPILTTTRDDIFDSMQHVDLVLTELQNLGETAASVGQDFLHGRATYFLKRNLGHPRYLPRIVTACLHLKIYRMTFGDPWAMLQMYDRFSLLDNFISEPKFSTDLGSDVEQAYEAYEKMRSGLEQQLQGPCQLSEQHVSNPLALREAEKWHNVAAIFESLVHQRQTYGLYDLDGEAMYNSPRTSKLGAPGVSVACFGDVVGFRRNTTWALTSWDDLLCLRSLSLYRRNAFLVLHIDRSIPCSTTASLMRVFEWQDRCIRLYGNEGYELAKATESVFKARLMQIADGPFKGDAFSLMIEKQQEKEKKLNPACPLVEDLRILAQSVENKREATELFGAFKFCGHPYIDPKLASTSARTYGKADSSACFSETLMMRNQFCDMILRGYLRKHARWPSLSFHGTTITKLQRLAKSQPLILGPGAYPLEDWLMCSFEKFMDFDYHLDYLEMMDDKSLGLDSQDAWKAWASLRKEAPHLARIPDERAKKLIIRMLAMPEFDPVKICQYMRTANLTAEDLCMALYPKEREFKLEARLFVMLSFTVRYFLTVAERNFKTLMKSYLDDQSMTKGRKGTMQHLEQMANANRSGHTDTVFIEIDLTRWNLLWQGNVVDPVSRVVDTIFGAPGAFSRGHQIFEASTIVVRIADDTPPGITPGSRPSDWPESEYVWRGHKGGFEGIIQGQWTACTQAEIKLVLSTEPIEGYSLLGQGDNQILAVNYNRDSNLSPQAQALEVAGRITRRLETRFKLLNQIVKPEECLVSRSTVTYSKIVWCDGVQIPTTLKHASTVAPVGTSYIPSIVTGLEAVSSGCRASADSFHDPSTAYLYYLILFRDFLRRSVKTMPSSTALPEMRLDADLLTTLSILPSDLGGLPTLGPSDFIYGGCSDRLSSSISSIVVAAHSYPIFRSYLGLLESDIPWKKTPNPQALLEDPFSVPIDRAIGATSKIEAAMKEVLPGITRNKDILPIVSRSVDEYDRQLSTFLTESRPFYPLLMADIRELSIVGVRKKIQTKFVGTRTIQSLMRRNAPINYRITVINGDQSRVSRAIDLIQTAKKRKLTSQLDSRSIFDRAECYRNRWFPGSPSVVKGVTTLHPFEARVDDGLNEYSDNYIEVITREPGARVISTPGPHSGRWGDRTWEHRKGTGITVLGKERSVLAAKRLLLLESQLAAGGTLQAAIRQVLGQRTKVDADLLASVMPEVIGGVAAHRWDSTIEDKTFAWLGPVTITQHASVQTDSMSSTSGGDVDWLFCFQEHIFSALQLARQLAIARPTERIAIRVHYSLESKHKVESNPVTGGRTLPPPPPTDYLSTNPLVTARELLFKTLSSELPTEIAPVIDLRSCVTRSHRVGIMTHYFLDQLENPLLSDLAVKGKETPAGLSIDVGIIKGMGLQDLILAAGAAVAMRAAEIAMSQPVWQPRGSYLTSLDRLSEVAAMPLARFASAPGVRNQKWVRETGVLIAPNAEGVAGLKNVITSLVRRAAVESIDRMPSVLQFRLICSSSAERATPSRVLGCLIALMLLLESEGDEREAHKLYRKHLRGITKSVSEEERLAVHVYLLKTIESTQDLISSVFARMVIKGGFIRRVTATFEDSTRFMRTSHENIRALAVAPIKIKRVPVHPLARTEGKFVTDPPKFPHLHVVMPVELSSRRLVRRNLAWNYGYSSISRESLKVLAVLKTDINKQKCALVGVGNGAMARDLFVLGASRVIGVDLLSSFPRGSGVATAYLPPELPASLPPNSWSWLSAVVRCGGDWFDSKVQKSLFSESPEVVIMDIQSGQRDLFQRLTPFLQPEFKTKVITREVLTEKEYGQVVSIFAASLTSVKVLTVDLEWPKSIWFVLDFKDACNWTRGNKVNTKPTTFDLLDHCPSEEYYPNCVARSWDVISKGRFSGSQPLHRWVDEAIKILENHSDLKPKDFVDVSLTALLSDYILSLLDQQYTTERLADKISVDSCSDPPASIHGIMIANIPRSQYRSLMTRILPKLVHIDNNGRVQLNWSEGSRPIEINPESEQ